jgi:hypothetical protein
VESQFWYNLRFALVTVSCCAPIFALLYFIYRVILRIPDREPELVTKKIDEIREASFVDISRAYTRNMHLWSPPKVESDPDKQCQGCGAFGKGNRCFYCKRTYEQRLLYAPLDGRRPVWLSAGSHSASEAIRMVDDASSWSPPYKYITPITLDTTGN